MCHWRYLGALVCQLSAFVERVSLIVAVKCGCFVMQVLRNIAFIPLLNFLSLKIMPALFLINVSTSCDLSGAVWHFS